MPYLCEWCECDFACDDFDTFYSHVREHTKDFYDDNKVDINSTNDSGPFSCLWMQCFSESCENERELFRHVLFHGYHAYLKHLGLKVQEDAKLSPCSLDAEARNLVPDFPEEFSCHWEKCDVVTSCPRYYYRHVDLHISSVEKENSDDNVLPCKWKDCSFTSKKRNKLKEHCRTHTHEKCFSCPNCGGLFSNKTKFLDHLRRQNTMESESYQCSHCFKYCASERILRDHMRHHVNHVKCSLCDMTCPTKSALRHHLNFRHSNEKPFSCDMCDSSFKSNNDLRRHQQTHNPVYSFSCEEEDCNYVTKTLQNLRRHYKIYHEGPTGGRYECHICGRRYSRGTGLTKHLKKEHTFRWPSGHNRFRYKEHDDGMYRLQTVRFESVELSQQLEALENRHNGGEGEESEGSWEPSEGSNRQEIINMTSQEYENQLRNNRLNLLSKIRENKRVDDKRRDAKRLDVRRRQMSFRAGESRTSANPDEANGESSVPPELSPTHENFLHVLNQFSEQYHQTNTEGLRTRVSLPRNTEDTEPSSSIQRSHYTSCENIAAHAVLEMQEAASLLATLRNSGVTS